MKTSLKTISLLASAALFTLNSSSAVETDPVGYVSVDIVGGGGTSIISSAGLVQPAAYSNVGDITSGNVLTVSSASWAVDEFAGDHYVQFSNGEWSAVTSNTATILSLESTVSNATGISFSIRPLNTFDSLFGSDNSVGFTGGTSLAQADIVAIFDQATQNFAGLYYYNTSRTRWENSGNVASGGTILYPDEALVVIGKSAKTITFSGTVQLGTTSGSLAGVGQSSLLPNPYSVDVKISEAGFESIIVGGSNFGSSDKLFVWDSAAQQFNKLYYYDTDDSQWKTSSNVVVGDTDIIQVGGAVLIVRSNASVTEKWVLDQPFTL